jgi:putative MATE family efflux protein
MTENNNYSIKNIWTVVIKSIKGEAYDYTKGSIKMAIALLAIPMILELSLESVFAVVDMYFVGRLPNAEVAITTVGLTEATMSMIYTIGIGLSVGATAIVARRVGEKDFNGAAKSGAQAIVVGFALSLVIMVLGVYFASGILKLMGAEEKVVAEGTIFTKIMFASSPAIILLFLINGIYRGAGDAAMAMKSLWIASGVNIILCPILIYGFLFVPALGLKGAALATAIGRTSGLCYQCYHLLKNKGILKFMKQYFMPEMALIKNLISIATPATFQFFIQSGSWVFMAYLVSKTGGTEASAGYQVAIRNIVFFILPAWGMSNAAATLVGQNLGAKEPQRAEKSVLLATKYNAIFMGIITILFFFFSKQLVGLFTEQPVAIKYGADALKIIGLGYIFYGIGMIMIQSLNGAGDTVTPTWINIVCFWLIQIPLAWLLSTYLKMGPLGVFIAIPASETLLALAAYYFFRKGKWKEVKV